VELNNILTTAITLKKLILNELKQETLKLKSKIMEYYVQLNRFQESDQGTFGILKTKDSKFSCYTIELPWRENKTSISRIFPGLYECQIRVSPKFGEVYHIKNVQERSYVLFHSGNYAGDIYKNYKTHSNGCILLGKNIGKLLGQNAVLSSKIILREFMDFMDYKPFKLLITENFGGK
jgi:hypothetical protein